MLTLTVKVSTVNSFAAMVPPKPKPNLPDNLAVWCVIFKPK